MRWPKLTRLGLGALLVLAGHACLPEPAYEDRMCSAERPCPQGFVCRSDRCLRACGSDDECRPDRACRDGACTNAEPGQDAAVLEEDAGTTGPDASTADGSVPDGSTLEPNCSACDTPGATCIEEDSVYRTYVNVGPCPDQPAQCAFTAFDMECASCTDTCLALCRDRACDDLQGGCREAGYCVPDPGEGDAACAYLAKADSSTCTTELGAPGLCESGVCFTACPNGCDDGNPCTLDTCDPQVGCVHADNQDACNDGEPCTYDDRCSGGTCAGTPITCVSDDCMERACDGTSACSEQPRPADTPCGDDGETCTQDLCDGSGACVHPSLPDGQQCGPVAANRCCSGTCVDISVDEQHCGGCGTACESGFACEPIESSPSCGGNVPARVSGRCLCQNANAHCPDNRGQVCRLTTYLDGNRCVPDSTTAMPCSPGATIRVVPNCPAYCAY